VKQRPVCGFQNVEIAWFIQVPALVDDLPGRGERLKDFEVGLVLIQRQNS